MKMLSLKQIILFFTLYLFPFSFLYSERLPVDTTTISTTADTVHISDPYDTLTVKNETEAKKKKTDDKNSESGQIISSWKFYTIMLAFPITLIMIFIFVYIRGKRG